jgi:hypothetical protein
VLYYSVRVNVVALDKAPPEGFEPRKTAYLSKTAAFYSGSSR